MVIAPIVVADGGGIAGAQSLRLIVRDGKAHGVTHVGDLDGTHERILGDGITGGAVDGVDLAADVCGDSVIVLTGEGLYLLLLVGYLVGETCKVDLGSGKSFFSFCA